MTIDRRGFVTGAALIVVAPTLTLLPASSPALPTELGPASLTIEGWSIPDEGSAAAALWIRVDRSWRTAWRCFAGREAGPPVLEPHVDSMGQL